MQEYHPMNRRVLFHDCPILDRSPSRGALRFKVGEDSGGGFPATTSKDIYHGMLSPPPGPLRFRRECEGPITRRRQN